MDNSDNCVSFSSKQLSHLSHNFTSTGFRLQSKTSSHSLLRITSVSIQLEAAHSFIQSVSQYLKAKGMDWIEKKWQAVDNNIICEQIHFQSSPSSFSTILLWWSGEKKLPYGWIWIRSRHCILVTVPCFGDAAQSPVTNVLRSSTCLVKSKLRSEPRIGNGKRKEFSLGEFN